MGEGEGVLESSVATPYYHEYGDPSIIMDKEQMLQLLDSPESSSMFPSPTEDLKRNNAISVPVVEMELEEEMVTGIAANDLGSLLEQFLEYEEKQVSSRPASPQSTTNTMGQKDLCLDNVGDKRDTIGKNSGERVFSGKLQDHNYAIPVFVVKKENSTAEEPVADCLPDADAKMMENQRCESNEKHDEESKMDIDSQPQSLENSQDVLFDKSSQLVNEIIASPLKERSSELEESWNPDKCRRDQQPKRRKRSYSSDSDDSDYDDSRHQSSQSNFHSHGKRCRSSGSSSDEESDRERYSVSRFERVHTCSKPEYQSRNSRGCNPSSRHTRNEISRNRRQKTEEKTPRSYAHDIEQERKLNFKFNRDTKDTAKEERRIVYIGKISDSMTKDDVWKRFRPFGPIEKVSVHIREKGDNYAFVTYFEPESAVEAIENGNSDSSKIKLDLCFGGRRRFCGGTYVDFDSHASFMEKQQESQQKDWIPTPVSGETDFDALLKMFQKEQKTR